MSKRLFSRSPLALTVLAIAASLSLHACGSSGNNDPVDSSYDPNNTGETWQGPDGGDSMRFDDAACQTQASGANAVVEAGIFEWHQGQIHESVVPMTAVTSAPVLASRHITRTTYGLRERANCELSGSQVVCPSEFDVVEQAKPLKICRDRAMFPRTSHETVALTGLYTLNRAYEFHNSLPSRANNLPATELVVLPRVERSFPVRNASGGSDTRISLVTDNLAYAPAYRSGPAFMIYPKSQKAAESGLWKDLFLWEVPWAMSHEFGHHILRTYALAGSNNLSLGPDSGSTGSMGGEKLVAAPPMFDWSRVGFRPGMSTIGLLGFDMALPFRITIGNPFQSSGRSVGPSLYWGAVNEGFADLYARYTRNSEDGQLRGVDCFANSRDVESANFGDGSAKVYDARVKSIFLSTQEMDGSASCSAPDFQGIHSIGAIVAHGLDAVFESVAADVATRRAFGSVEEKSMLKGDMLLRWARRMGNQIRSANQVSLGSFVRDAFVVAAETRASAGFPAGELGRGQCVALQAILPALAPEIIGNGGLRCAP